MAHPEMFDHDDPLLGLVSQIALGFPGANQKVSHGRPAFFTNKVFAYYGGSVRRGAGDWVQHPQSIMVLPDPDERDALLNDSRHYVPAYIGPSGWLGFDLAETSDFEEVAELVEMSYRRTASVRLVAELDSRQGR